MKVLMVGEYSGFFNQLKRGLIANGADVTLIANGDGFKKIKGADYCFYDESKRNPLYVLFSMLVKPLFFKPLYEKYDCVLLINLDVFNPFILKRVLRKLSKSSRNIYLTSCGYDYALYKAFLANKFDYYMFDSNYDSITRYNGFFFRKYTRKGTEDDLIRKYVKKVIPTAYEYSVGYDREVCSNIILLPFDPDVFCPTKPETSDKITFFHGLNREEEKGTKYIVAALEKLKEKYPDRVNVIVDGKMSYEKYVRAMSESDVVIDQCKSYWYGMNALAALSQGKVVLSGARDESLSAVNIDRKDCPIIPIRPDVDDIYAKMEQIVLGKIDIGLLKSKGVDYVRKHHYYKDVARLYLNVFKENNKRAK